MSTSSSDGGPSDNFVYIGLSGDGVNLNDIITSAGGAIVAVVIMILNSIVMQVIFDLKDKREPSDIALASLAVADFLAGLLLLYNSVFTLMKFIDNVVECNLRVALMLHLGLTSVCHLALLALERYIKITRPYKYEYMFTEKTMVISASVVWVVAGLLTYVPTYAWRVDMKNVTNSRQRARPPEYVLPEVCRHFFEYMNPNYLTMGLIFYYGPILIIVFLYILLYRVARHHATVIAAQNIQNTPNGHKDNSTMKFAKTVAILTGLFAICWAPLAILVALQISGLLRNYNTVEQNSFLLITLPFGFANSIVNPIIYAIKISAVRRRFLQIYTKIKNFRVFKCFLKKPTVSPLEVEPSSMYPTKDTDVTVVSGHDR